jgi:hypothetical protein
MTNKEAFTPEEWTSVLEGPTSAGLILVTAARGGSLREMMAISKAYVAARSEHGTSELLDAIVAAKPQADHTRYHSPQEMRQAGLQHVRDGVALVQSKATPAEVEDYRRFVLNLAQKAAEAHKEHGVLVSPEEEEAIAEIATALGTGAP